MIAAAEAVPKSIYAALFPCALGLCAAGIALAPTLPIQAAIAAALFLPPLCWLVVAEPQRWLALFFITALLAPPLPIALGDSGPHVALVFAALGLLVGALHRTAWRIETTPLFWSLFVFLCVLVASSAVGFALSGWAIGAGSLVRVTLLGIACFVFLFSAYGPVGDRWRMTRLLYFAAVASTLFACLDFYFQWPAPAGFGQQFVWLDSGVFRRAQGVFYESSTLGNLCAFFLTMSVLCLLQPQERPISKAALMLGLPVIATALVMSYSRASLVSLGISVSLLLWLHRDRLHVRRWKWAPLLLSAACGALVYLVFGQFVRGYLQRVWFTVPQLFSSFDRALSGRVDSWHTVLQLLAENPWVLFTGVGYKTLPYSEVAGRQLIVDNMYLSLLAETGVVGLACFLALNFAILSTAWRARRSFHGMWLFSFWVGQVFQMMSGDLFTYWRVIPVYFWVMGQADRVNRSEHPVR